MSNNKNRLHQELTSLRHQYLQQLPDRLHQIQQSWHQLQSSADSRDCQHLLYRQLHNLAGSGASFGYPEISDAARQAEALLREAQGPRLSPLSRPESKELDERLLVLLSVCEEIVKHQQPPQPLSESDCATLDYVAGASKLIYLLEPNLLHARELQRQLQNFGYQVETQNGLQALRNALAQRQPDALILDFNGAAGRALSTLPNILAELDCDFPCLVIAEQDDLEARLDAVRAGARGYLTKPISIGQLVDQLDKQMPHRPPEPYRVLVIDDDLALARLHALILKQAGMRVRTLNDPLQMLKVMDTFNPELLLLDLYMPGCNGLELTQVLRQIDRYLSIPILFLCSEKDLQRHHQAMHLGAEEFLSKPVPPDQLINQVQIRAARSRALRALMISDSLTGLYNHSVIKEYLKTECVRAARDASTLSVAMLDIDHLKQVNDTYGHGCGDLVIKALARLLKQRLRASDLIGRYSGEEFLVILPGSDTQQARQVINELRESFSGIEHRHSNGRFKATLSAGLAAFPAQNSDERALEAADQALYQAKQQGRNRVVCS